MSVYQKLIAVQSELKAPKNQHNSFGNYNYRSLEAISETLKPILKKNETAISISDKPVVVANENLRCYIETTATFIDIETGETIEFKTFASEPETEKSSDIRKRLLASMFKIDEFKN